MGLRVWGLGFGRAVEASWLRANTGPEGLSILLPEVIRFLLWNSS